MAEPTQECVPTETLMKLFLSSQGHQITMQDIHNAMKTTYASTQKPSETGPAPSSLLTKEITVSPPSTSERPSDPEAICPSADFSTNSHPNGPTHNLPGLATAPDPQQALVDLRGADFGDPQQVNSNSSNLLNLAK